MTGPGAYNDNDMLDVCNGGFTDGENRAQFSTWAILTSPLILGNDVRNLSEACADIILNEEVIAVNQDPLVSRGKLVHQWPDPTWPNVTRQHSDLTAAREELAGGPGPQAPALLADLKLMQCLDPSQDRNASQLFTLTEGGLLTNAATPGQALCVTYQGYKEGNFGLAPCTGWSQPGIGSQKWRQVAARRGFTLHPEGNDEKCIDVFNCDVDAGVMQTCTCNGTDCYDKPSGNCGLGSQEWLMSSSAGSTGTLVSSLSGDGQRHCLTAVPAPSSTMVIKTQVWVKPLQDGSRAVVAFNRDDLAHNTTVSWEWMGWPTTQKASVRDLWKKTDSAAAGSFNISVPPHDVVMLRITPGHHQV